MSRPGPRDEHVLVIEPSSYYVNLIRDWLADLGFKDIITCATEERARLLVNDMRFVALVINSKLEDGSGIKLARAIRHTPNAINRLTPMIILDSKATRRRISAARDGGVSEYVCKPMSRRSFVEHFQFAITDKRSFIRASNFFGPDRRRRPADWDSKDRRRQAPRRVSLETGLADA